MDVFKLQPGPGLVYPIDNRAFLSATGKREPYCQRHKENSESLYAVCPACDNPIQIIGLYRDTAEGGRSPYGKHIPKTIPGLAEYDAEAYEYCPYSNSNWRRSSTARRKMKDSTVKRILTFLRANFANAVTVLSEDIDVRISLKQAKIMLESYIGNAAWSYRNSLNESNLPWVMGESAPGQSLFGQNIRAGSVLHQELEARCPEVTFEPAGAGYVRLVKAGDQFISISYHFLEHKFTPSEDGQHQTESIRFRVVRGSPPTLEELYSKTILVDTNRFLRLCQAPPTAQANSSRAAALLEIAEAEIPLV